MKIDSPLLLPLNIVDPDGGLFINALLVCRAQHMFLKVSQAYQIVRAPGKP